MYHKKNLKLIKIKITKEYLRYYHLLVIKKLKSGGSKRGVTNGETPLILILDKISGWLRNFREANWYVTAGMVLKVPWPIGNTLDYNKGG